MTTKQAEDLQSLEVQQAIGLLDEVMIEQLPADAMIVDIEQGNNKLVWYSQPKGIEHVAKQQVKKGKKVKLNPTTQLEFFVDIWQHMTETCYNKKPLTLWIGTAEEVEKQLKELYQKAGLDPSTTDFMKFVPNIALLEAKNPTKAASKSTSSSEKPKKV